MRRAKMCLDRTGASGSHSCRFLQFGAAKQGQGIARQGSGAILWKTIEKGTGRRMFGPQQKAREERLAGGVMGTAANCGTSAGTDIRSEGKVYLRAKTYD